MTAPGENLRIDGARLWDSIMEMAKIGPGVAGGNNRQTLTDADAEGRRLFKRWCDAAGLSLGVDAMGTMFADAGRRGPGRAAGLCRQPPRHPADRGQVRRGAGGARGARGGAVDERPRDQDAASDRRHQLDQRGGGALRAGDAGERGVRRGDRPRLRLRPDRPRRQELRGGARADRLEGRGAGGRAEDARLLRAAHRAGADPRGRGPRDRRRHPLPGALVARVHPDRQGGAHRLDADGHAGQRRARHGADLRDGAGGGDGRAARLRRRRRAGDVQPELAQRAAGQGGVHRRHPLARPGEARPDAGAGRGRGGGDLRRRSASAARSRRSGTSTR